MKAVLSGQITSFELLGEVLRYEGTVLCPGTWQGIDGNKISYSSAVTASGAESFSGVMLHEGHLDQSREAVKGFNAVAWYQDGCIRNRGYVWDKPTIGKIINGEYPLGQSMEAEVYVDDQMNAIRVQGTSIAIGISSPACRVAKIEKIESVMMSMEEDKKKILLSAATLIGEHSEGAKLVALAEEDYAQLKALAEKGRAMDSFKVELEGVKASLLAMKVSNEAAEIAGANSEIVAMDKDFKVCVYCEGITDHAMKMRMLNAYKTTLAKLTPILPVATKMVEIKNEELKDVAQDVFGMKLEDMFLDKGGK